MTFCSFLQQQDACLTVKLFELHSVRIISGYCLFSWVLFMKWHTFFFFIYIIFSLILYRGVCFCFVLFLVLHFLSQISKQKQIYLAQHAVLHHSYAGLEFEQPKVHNIPKIQHLIIYAGSPNPVCYRNITCPFEVTFKITSTEQWRHSKHR